MRLFKEKLAWAAPIAVILIIALFSVNLFAQGDPQVRNLPVAFIVNDEGVHVDNVIYVLSVFKPVRRQKAKA